MEQLGHLIRVVARGAVPARRGRGIDKGRHKRNALPNYVHTSWVTIANEYLLVQRAVSRRRSGGKRELVHSLALEGVVGIEVLAGGVEVGVTHEVLHRHDVAPLFKEARGVGVAEFMQSCVLDLRPLCYTLQSPEEMRLSSTY